MKTPEGKPDSFNWKCSVFAVISFSSSLSSFPLEYIKMLGASKDSLLLPATFSEVFIWPEGGGEQHFLVCSSHIPLSSAEGALIRGPYFAMGHFFTTGRREKGSKYPCGDMTLSRIGFHTLLQLLAYTHFFRGHCKQLWGGGRCEY